MKREVADALLEARASRRAAVLITDLDGGEQWLLQADGPAPTDLPPGALDAAREALRTDRSVPLEADGRSLFVNVFNPPLRMIVVGAVHIAQPLARMAALAGFDVTVIDPRAAFATEQRFPGVDVRRAWPDDALETLAPDARTAVVTLTHDPKIDDPALQAALRSSAFYIGSLGSTRTHGARLERLRREGFGEAALERIRGPVGLPIGASSPAEIAVSILAQVIESVRSAA